MAHSVLDAIRAFIVNYGYWAVALALLCENAGIPVPGETTLLFASFLAYSEHRLHLGWIIVVATCAATLGDNIGYLVGRRGGRPLLERYQHILRIPRRSIQRGEALFRRFGSMTIFFARFIFGLRIFAGPMAGVLRMPWKSFALFNFLGAAVWVSVIATAGYLFGQYWETLEHIMSRFNLAVILAVAILVLLFWRKRHQRAPGNED